MCLNECNKLVDKIQISDKFQTQIISNRMAEKYTLNSEFPISNDNKWSLT